MAKKVMKMLQEAVWGDGCFVWLLVRRDASMQQGCKDKTSKDPFSRCEICKNLGYRLSGRSQRQEHH